MEEKASGSITPEAMTQLLIVSAKPPKVHSTLQLLGLKQRERNALDQAVGMPDLGREAVISPTEAIEAKQGGFQAIEDNLQIRQVSTPQTGNCMAMSIAQALADNDLLAHTDQLEANTASLKIGTWWTGQLHLTDHYDHFVRTTTLVNVQRGWTGMEAHKSLK